MRLLQWESWCAILAFVLTGMFIVLPGPYPMAIFTFIAQPLFAIAALGYIAKVLKDIGRTRRTSSRKSRHQFLLKRLQRGKPALDPSSKASSGLFH